MCFWGGGLVFLGGLGVRENARIFWVGCVVKQEFGEKIAHSGDLFLFVGHFFAFFGCLLVIFCLVALDLLLVDPQNCK